MDNISFDNVRLVGLHVLVETSKQEERIVGGLVIPESANQNTPEGLVRVSNLSGVEVNDKVIFDKALFDKGLGKTIEINNKKFFIVHKNAIAIIVKSKGRE